jgi:hypothetical protein
MVTRPLTGPAHLPRARIYRVFNQRLDANHILYTTSLAICDQMVKLASWRQLGSMHRRERESRESTVMRRLLMERVASIKHLSAEELSCRQLQHRSWARRTVPLAIKLLLAYGGVVCLPAEAELINRRRQVRM